MNSFDIGIPCGQNSDFYVAFLLENMAKTMISTKEETRIILGINNYRQFDLSVLEPWRERFNIEHHFVDTNTPPGSVGHAMVLEFLLNQMTSTFGAFIDCDIGFLECGWDTIMINELCTGTNTEAFGLQYTNVQKYQGFPNLIVCAFRPAYVKNLKIDFRPLLDPPNSEYVVQTELEARSWNSQIGATVILDCGFRFPLKMIESGASGKIIPFVGTGILGIGQEHHFNGKPFLTHLKGSSVKDKNHNGANTWMKIVRNFLKVQKGIS